MLCHFFKLSRPAPLSPVPASFKLLPSFHLFPFLLTYSAHAIAHWVDSNPLALVWNLLGTCMHMVCQLVHWCTLTHGTWALGKDWSHMDFAWGAHMAHAHVCAAISCNSDSLFASHFQLAELFYSHAPPPRPAIHREFCSENADWSLPDTILTLAFNLGIISGNRDSAAQRGGSPVPIMRGQAGVWLFPIARVISCYEFYSPLGIIRSMPLRNKTFSDRSIPDPNQN